ncbi:DNA ligase [compost metagenome]
MKIIEQLKKASEAYYKTGRPIMDDFEFDKQRQLLKEIVEKEPDHPDASAAREFLESVGTTPDLNTYSAVTHNPLMKSLDNAFGEQQYREWFNTLPVYSFVVVSWKMDGLAARIYYKKGVLVTGATSGNGQTGEDVTASIIRIPNVPKRLPKPLTFSVDGEICLSWANFEKANEMAKEPFANPRNAAAGILRRKKPGMTVRLLSFHAYGAHFEDTLPSHADNLTLLEELGFTTAPWALLDLNKAVEEIARIESRRLELPYMIDGVVSRVNDNQTFTKLGFTSHHPRGAIASKLKAERVEVKLDEVIWTKGLKGKISPNARYQTIKIAGTDNDRCLLHTMDKINQLGIMVNDSVFIEKAGDIIPQVVGYNKDMRDGTQTPIQSPTQCPVCSGPVTMRGAYHYCENKSCGDVGLNKLQTFVNAIDFKGIGPVSAKAIADNGDFVHHEDFLTLDANKLEAAGVAPKLAAKLAASIASLKISAEKLLQGFGIDTVGRGTSEDIVAVYPDLRDLIGKSSATFESINGIGPKTAIPLAEWFNNDRNAQTIYAFYDSNIVESQSKPVITGGRLEGKLVCITGTLSQPKSVYQKLIEDTGGQFTNDFKTSISVLVVGEAAGSKVDKAQKKGIPLWSEDDLKKELGI